MASLGNDELEDLVAAAIKAADRSYFNEDYLKQAKNVLLTLRKNGYEVVPLRPSERFVKFIEEKLPFGRHKPSQWVAAVYTLMIENARKMQ